ncbi:MAG: murein biosynthesis integral membrane protein MurJ [Oligoflexus sp.]|nr:murein biosynthesis integral membrane protein MurJ [Oligoflexus sp.]
MAPQTKPKASRGGAIFVAAGILLSRLAGLLRERVFAYYFGNGAAADVFRAAFRIPNLLQNLFGEGALSASFIPVYAGLGEKDPKEAARVAGVILSLLCLLMSILVLVGVLATPWLIDWIVPGFQDERRDAAIRLVRILFPGIGLLVISAFCLGVLNSHRKFFISYTAPVLWNGAMIATLMFFQDADSYKFAENLAWGAVAGSFLQVAIQIPWMLRFMKDMRPGLEIKSTPVRTILTRFFPNIMSRGIIQISSYIEGMIASFLPTGALAAIGYAQILTTLPTSLFGTAIAASNLIDMSKDEQGEEVGRRLHQGMRQIAFFIVPSAMAFVCMGNVLAATLFKTGKFGEDDTIYIWTLLAASALGLLASTQGRLLATTFYALKNTITPLRCSIYRVLTSTVGAVLFAIYLPKYVPMSPAMATAGISFATSLAAVLEFLLLRNALKKAIAFENLPGIFIAKLFFAATTSGLLGAILYRILNPMQLQPWISGGFAIAAFGVCYAGLSLLLKIEEATAFGTKIRKRLPF